MSPITQKEYIFASVFNHARPHIFTNNTQTLTYVKRHAAHTNTLPHTNTHTLTNFENFAHKTSKKIRMRALMPQARASYEADATSEVEFSAARALGHTATGWHKQQQYEEKRANLESVLRM